MLTQERLKELLHYDPETGVFTNLTKRSKRVKVGEQTGTPSKTGYRRIKIDYKPYLEHRLAWLYTHGVWPTNHIDHIDAIKDHNWISNLQDITPQQNTQRINYPRKDNTSGYRGVSWAKHAKKFTAQISVNSKIIRLGYFGTALEASEAYQAAKSINHFKESLP